MKTFKIRFSNVINLLCVLVYALCAFGIFVSVWRIVKLGVHGFNDILQYPLLIGVSIFCIALVTSILIKSQYLIDKTHLISQYGFLKSKFLIKDITEMVLDTQTNKLTVKWGEAYMILQLQTEWKDEFIRSLLDVNPDISYSFTLSDTPEDKQNEEK